MDPTHRDPTLANYALGPARRGARSDVDGLTQGLRCRFQHSCRVGEDRSGDVLEPSAHLDGKAERR